MELSIENVGRSTFLVYRMQEEEELDNIGLGMIENNNISGILPIALNHYDEERRLAFNITSQISLSRLLMGKVSRKKILNVFVTICDTLMEAEEYLLEDSFFLLDNDYIYTSPSNGKASMVYFPILREAEPLNLTSFFIKLIISIQSDQDENCDYVAKIISFLNSKEGFDLKKFRDLVYELRLADGSVKAQNSHTKSSSNPGNSGASWNGSNSQNDNGGAGYSPDPYAQQGGQSYAGTSQDPDGGAYAGNGGNSGYEYAYPGSDMETPYDGGYGQQYEPPKKKSLLGGLFKKKDKKESKKTEKKSLFGRKKDSGREEEMAPVGFEVPGQDAYGAGGGYGGYDGSASGGAGGYAGGGYAGGGYSDGGNSGGGYSGGYAGGGYSDGGNSGGGYSGGYAGGGYSDGGNSGGGYSGGYAGGGYSDGGYSGGSYAGGGYSDSGNAGDGYYAGGDGQRKAVNQGLAGSGSGSGAYGRSDYEYSDGEGYTVMGQSDGFDEEDELTELDEPTFEKGTAPTAAGSRNANLTRVSNGERKELAGDIVRVGRQRDAVDFMITGNKSISHTHADIIRKTDGIYYICDLNSKNHTYLNGERLVSGREYPLHKGDKIRLANEEFIFEE